MVRRPALPEEFDQLLYTAAGRDDFFEYTSGQMWTAVGDGTAAIVTPGYHARGGVILLDTGVTLNAEEYLISTNLFCGFRRGVQWGMEVRYKWFSLAAGGGNLILGFLQDAAANSILDGGTGLMAGKHCAAICQFDNENKLRCVSSQSLTRTSTLTTQEGRTGTNASTISASETDFRTARIEVLGGQPDLAGVGFGPEIQVHFSFDPTGKGNCQPLRDVENKPIVHAYTAQSGISNDQKMVFGFKVGSGGGTDLQIDYVRWWVTRGGA